MIQHHNKQVGRSGILKIIIEGKGFQRHAMKSKSLGKRKREKFIQHKIQDHRSHEIYVFHFPLLVKSNK